MSIDLNRDAPNVVTELQFKVLLQSGHHVDIIARGQPERRGAFWYGDWIISVLSKDRTIERILIPARTGDEAEIRFRKFKTANGLISFMHKFGFPSVTIPMGQGGRASHQLFGDSAAKD